MKGICVLLAALLVLMLAGCIEAPETPTKATEPTVTEPVETTPATIETVKPCLHEWQVDLNKPHTATCTQAGLEYYICTLCQEGKSEDKPALGHNWEITGYISGDCGTGILYEQRCFACWAKREITITPEEHAYDWENPGRTEPATCTKDGFRYVYCTTCGDRTMEVLPATGHEVGEGGICTRCSIAIPSE